MKHRERAGHLMTDHMHCSAFNGDTRSAAVAESWLSERGLQVSIYYDPNVLGFSCVYPLPILTVSLQMKVHVRPHPAGALPSFLGVSSPDADRSRVAEQTRGPTIPLSHEWFSTSMPLLDAAGAAGAAASAVHLATPATPAPSLQPPAAKEGEAFAFSEFAFENISFEGKKQAACCLCLVCVL
jgi:hypothetical protein